MKKDELELKLKELYDFTVDFISTNGFPPSIREICSTLNIKSTAMAYSYLNKLKSKGLLDKSPLKKRALTLPNKNLSCKKIPVVGLVRAGSPIFAVENLDGYCPLPAEFSNSNVDFALRVDGESMINAGIYDNDLIVVKQQETADNGDIVVALIDDSATVKRFFKQDGKIVLHPENDTMSDMIFDKVEILGIVKGLIRKF